MVLSNFRGILAVVVAFDAFDIFISGNVRLSHPLEVGLGLGLTMAGYGARACAGSLEFSCC